MIKTNKMFLTASAMILSVSAQAFTLKGVVVDNSTKEPLIGATVQVGGTTTGVITDIDGRFEIKDIKGKIDSFININPWTQFYDLKDREDVPLSYADNVVMKNCECECNTFFDVKTDESQYVLSDFTFENLKINAKVNGFNENAIQNVKIKNIDIQKLL